MSIYELDQKTMGALQTLADTNLKISDAKTSLAKLREEESTYLEEREKATIAKVEAVLAESEEIVNKIKGNYDEITQFHNTVVSFVDFLSELQSNVGTVISNFGRKADLWEEGVSSQKVELAEIKKGLDFQEKGIQADKKSIKKAFERIEKEKILIESRQAQIIAALQVLEKKKNA